MFMPCTMGLDCAIYNVRVLVVLQVYREKSQSVFDFLTYSRKTGFSFSYVEVRDLIRLIGASNKIDGVE